MLGAIGRLWAKIVEWAKVDPGMKIGLLIIFVLSIAALTGATYDIIRKQRGGGMQALQMVPDFQQIGDDIGDGVEGSYSGKKNKGKTNAERRQFLSKPYMTYAGHGIPLKDEEKLPVASNNPMLMVHNLGLQCKPECCPSDYSCDNGCMCI